MSDQTVKDVGWELIVQVSEDPSNFLISNEMVLLVEARLPGVSNPEGISMPPCRIGAWAPITREALADPVAAKVATKMLTDQIYERAVEMFRPKPPPVEDRHPRVTRFLAWWDRETDSLRRVFRAGRHR